MMIFKIASRNIFLHWRKTLILGLIIAIGLFVLVLGNSLLDTITAGLEKTYTRSFAGDLAVVPPGDDRSMLTLGGTSGRPVALSDFAALYDYVGKLPGVKAVSPQLNTRALISIDEREGIGGIVAGVDSEAYQALFPDNLEVIEGEFLHSGEEGIVITERTREMLKDRGMSVAVGGSLLLTNRNPVSGFKVRQVTLRAVVRFLADNSLVQRISLTDPTTARVLAGLNEVGSPAAKAQFPGEIPDPDAAFDQGLELTDVSKSTPSVSAIDTLRSLLGGPSAASEPAEDPQTWTFLLVRLEDPGRGAQVASQIRHYLADNGSRALVQGWVATVGPLAEVAVNLKVVFNILVLIVGLVALLVIMNALVISVTERIPEIGTVRALGAQKGFVRSMITAETVLTSLLFGTVGIGGATVLLLVLGSVGIQAPNEVVALLMGGHLLRPAISPGALAQAFCLVGAVGVLASLYPVALALRVSPVQAMQSQ